MPEIYCLLVAFAAAAATATTAATVLFALALACKPMGNLSFWTMSIIAIAMYFAGTVFPDFVGAMTGW